MAEINIDQAEADALLALEKTAADSRSYTVLSPGDKVSIPLISMDKREKFLLDVNRNAIALSKVNLQSRVRTAVILARLDIGGAPHQNPDFEIIQCPHLHIYREGYADKWAFPVPEDRFSNLDDLWIALSEFMDFINVTQRPTLSRSLLA